MASKHQNMLYHSFKLPQLEIESSLTIPYQNPHLKSNKA